MTPKPSAVPAARTASSGAFERGALRGRRRPVALPAHPAVVRPVAALDDVVVDDRLEPRADVLEPGVEIRRRQVGREVLLHLPAQRGNLLVALRAEVGRAAGRDDVLEGEREARTAVAGLVLGEGDVARRGGVRVAGHEHGLEGDRDRLTAGAVVGDGARDVGRRQLVGAGRAVTMLEWTTSVAAPVASTVASETTMLFGPPATAGSAPRASRALVRGRVATRRRLPGRFPLYRKQERRCHSSCLRAYVAAPTSAQRRPAKRTASVARRMPISASSAHQTPTMPHPSSSAASASGAYTAAETTIAPAR